VNTSGSNVDTAVLIEILRGLITLLSAALILLGYKWSNGWSKQSRKKKPTFRKKVSRKAGMSTRMQKRKRRA